MQDVCYQPASHAGSSLRRPPRRHSPARIWGPKLQTPTPVRPREAVLAPREEGGAGRRRTAGHAHSQVAERSERLRAGAGPEGGACRAPVPTCPRFLPPRPCAYNPGCSPLPALLRRLPPLPGLTGKKFRAPLPVLGLVRGIPEGASGCKGVGTGRPPSDRAVRGKKEPGARVPVTHMVLLPGGPREGHKSQGLRSRWSMEVTSGSSFLDPVRREGSK